METLLCLSIALFTGLMLSRVAKMVQLPAVTAYLVAGVLLGPFALGRLGVAGLGFTAESVASMGLIADVALGFIAFSIGNEFRWEQLKHFGKQATIIGIFQAVFTTVLVDIALIALHFTGIISLPAAIVLGAVAAATAPAATLMVVRQYKANGPVTKILLPIVALDDAVGLVLFAVSFGVAKAINEGGVDAVSMLVEPLLEVALSILLGFVMGLLITYFERFFHSRSKRLSMSVAFVFMTVGLSMIKFEIGGVHIAFSSLLTCMMLGTVFCNICDFSEELMDRLDRWTAPLFILFFVISGAELELSVFTELSVVTVGTVYILARSIGKCTGANLSSRFTKCDPNIVKYLGITLLPQAGVALGMARKAKELGADGSTVANITLLAVLIYELVGPLMTKNALLHAGEIKPEGKVSARHAFLHARAAKHAAAEAERMAAAAAAAEVTPPVADAAAEATAPVADAAAEAPAQNEQAPIG